MLIMIIIIKIIAAMRYFNVGCFLIFDYSAENFVMVILIVFFSIQFACPFCYKCCYSCFLLFCLNVDNFGFWLYGEILIAKLSELREE